MGEEKESDAWINGEMAYLSVEMIFQVIIRIHQRFRIDRGTDRLISCQLNTNRSLIFALI